MVLANQMNTKQPITASSLTIEGQFHLQGCIISAVLKKNCPPSVPLRSTKPKHLPSTSKAQDLSDLPRPSSLYYPFCTDQAHNSKWQWLPQTPAAARVAKAASGMALSPHPTSEADLIHPQCHPGQMLLWREIRSALQLCQSCYRERGYWTPLLMPYVIILFRLLTHLVCSSAVR
jgi:hypothetical protein